MKFYVTERIGPKRSFTPEGFLLCQDVPIARIGILDYLESELPGVEGASGVIRVERNEEDVFAPEAIASFAGKPIVDDHPDEDVNPANWRKLAVGTVLNPRRGDGNFADVMMADLLVTDEDAIEEIQAGKVEVSCGYDANYKQLKPGLARQHGIVGNHLAIVKDGRCGPRCSIGDQAISVTMKEGQMAKVPAKKSFRDRLMAAVNGAIKSKDTAEVEKLAGEITEDEDIAEPDVKGTTANGITINVHGTGAPAAAASTTAETTDEEDPAAKEDPNKPILDAIAALAARMDKYEAGSSTTDADGDDEDEDDDTSTTDAEGDDDEDDKDKDKNKTKTGDKNTTRDSSGLANVFQDTVARAEILSPGIKVPTFDAKADRKKTRDALCGFRRKALDKAYATDEGKAAIDPLLTGKFDTKKLTCDAATIMFNAASTAMKAANNAGTTGTGKLRVGDTGAVKVATIADMNKGASDFWKRNV